jgi:hypothetical protein
MAISEGYERYVKEKHKKDINTKTHYLKMTKAIYGLSKQQYNGGRSLKKYWRH